MSATSRSAIIVFLIFAGCAKPIVTGVVKDPWGNAIAGAKIAIANTELSAVTDSNGRYGLRYVPGLFKITFAKDGYTTHELELNVSEKAAIPAAPVIMYPVPAKPGIYYIGDKKLQPLAADQVSVRKRVGAWSAEYEYQIDNRILNTVLVRTGKVEFIDTLTPSAKVFGEREGIPMTLYHVTYHLMTPEVHFDGSAIAPGDEIAKIGKEKLVVHRLTLPAGEYAWLQIGSGPVIGSAAPREYAYRFMAPHVPIRAELAKDFYQGE